MKSFKELKVWCKSHELTLEIYQASKVFPDEERYGLTSQIRRSAASVPANIAEGCGKNGDPEFARYLQISMGSASETEYHLILARDLGYLDLQVYSLLNDKVVEVKKMLNVFLQRLRSSANR